MREWFSTVAISQTDKTSTHSTGCSLGFDQEIARYVYNFAQEKFLKNTARLFYGKDSLCYGTLIVEEKSF